MTTFLFASPQSTSRRCQGTLYGPAKTVSPQSAAGLQSERRDSVTSDFDVVLYEAATPLYTFSVDGSSLGNLAQNFLLLPIPEQRLYPGRQYYLSVKPTTTNTVAAYSSDVADAAFWPLMAGDASCTYATRLDGGAWAANTVTRRLQAAVRISAIETGGGQAMATII